jgi:hypothetical protein
MSFAIVKGAGALKKVAPNCSLLSRIGLLLIAWYLTGPETEARLIAFPFCAFSENENTIAVAKSNNFFIVFWF